MKLISQPNFNFAKHYYYSVLGVILTERVVTL